MRNKVMLGMIIMLMTVGCFENKKNLKINKMNKVITKLMDASLNGRIEVVKELLKSEVNADELKEALMAACGRGHIEVVRELLKVGADVNTTGHYGTTVLMAASVRGHIEIVKELLRAGADVNAKDRDRETALIEASGKGHVEVVRELLKAGAEFNQRNGYVALVIASGRGHIEVVRELLKTEEAVKATDVVGITALIAASEGGHLEIVKELLKAGVDVNAATLDKRTALIEASGKGHVEVVKELLKVGGDVNAKNFFGRTALIAASYGGYTEVAEVLLKAGAEINAKEKDERVTKIFPKDGKTALMAASGMGHLDTVKLLIKEKADIQEAGSQGYTALIIAGENGHVEVVRELLRAGADVNAKNLLGKTVLVEAIYKGHKEVVKELLKLVPDIIKEYNMLSIASKSGNIELLEETLKAGADVNKKIGYITTALLLASQGGHLKAVRLLLKAGADVGAIKVETIFINKWGLKDLSLKENKDKIAIVYELIGAGANGEQRFLDELVKLTAEDLAISGTRHNAVPIETLRKYCAYISERELAAQQDTMDNTIIDNIIQKYLDKERLGELVYDIVSNMSIDDWRINIDVNLLKILHDYIRYLNRKNATMLIGQKINEEGSAINIIDCETLRGILNLIKCGKKEVMDRLESLKMKWAEGKRDLIELKEMKEEVLDVLFS